MREQLAQLGAGAHALAIQILGSREDAADAVHDAFATVLSKPAAWDPEKGPLKPWFLRVVRNRCIDLLRARRPAGETIETIADRGRTPEQVLEGRQRDRQLQRVLAGLPGDQRQILVLRDFLDLRYAEIADVLDIAPGTVMSRLHRARQALKEALANDDE